MTRSLLHSWRPALIAAALAASLPAAAAVPFTVRIPIRSPDLPVSGVKITIETPGVVAGTTFAVGTGTVTVPAAGSSAWTGIGGGDLVQASGSGNNATLLIFPASMLNAGNRCQYAAGAVQKDYAVTWSGTTVNGFRLTSYAAPTPDACACSDRRVKTNAAFFTAAPPGTNLGRHPMDIILVLDKSGSMSSATPGDPFMMSKWNALKWAVEQFIATWEVEGTTAGTTTGGTLLTEDRLALVMFDTTPQNALIGTAFQVNRGTNPAGPTHAWEAVKTKLGTFGPGGATALGGGLKNAILAKDPDRDLTVVLMTDGIQNMPPMVKNGTGAATGFKVLDFGSGDEPIKDKCVPILTLAMGTAAATEAELLDAISQQTAGTTRLTVASSSDLAFLATLVESLKGSTMTQLARKIGTLPSVPIPGVRSDSTAPTASAAAALCAPGPTSCPVGSVCVGGSCVPSTTPATDSVVVQLDGNVKNVIGVLSWLPFGRHISPPGLRFIAPDGKVAPLASASNGVGYTVQSVALPSGGAPGTWKVEILNATNFEPVTYHLTVYANEKSLDLGLRFSSAKHGTGEPLKLLAQVSLEGRMLTGLGNGLKVSLERPVGAVGTILHESKATGSTDGGTDPISPYNAKLDAVLQDPDVLGKVRTSPPSAPVAMTEDSSGRYSFTVNDTNLPGIYRFHVTLDTTGPSGEQIQRIETVEAAVEVLPTPQTTGTGTNVVVTDLGAGQYTIQVIPRDKFGNYSGPGKDVLVSSSSGRVTGVADQAVTGNYVASLADVTGDPKIRIAVEGRLVGDKKLSDWQKGVEPGPGPCPIPCGSCSAMGMGSIVFVLPLLGRKRRRAEPKA